MEGIVIKTIDYKEKSKLVYLYTPSGIISVKALDATKTKLGFITTLNLVDFERTSGKLPTVVEYSLKKSFYSLYEHLDKVGTISPILDVLFHLEEDANHTRIYPFLVECLMELEKTNEPYYILSMYLIKMLAVFGIRPELKKCVRCGNQGIVNFSIYEGGALCGNCSSKNEDNLLIYEAFKELYYTRSFEVKELRVSFKRLLEEIYNYYSSHANFRLKNYSL